MEKGKSWDEKQHWLHLDNYRRQCEGLEGGASHTLASAPRSTAPSSVRSCHGKVGCACKHSFFFLPFFFFFQGGLSFPLLLLRDGGSRAATRRNDPILVHENAIIPVNRLSKRTEKGDGEKRERKKIKTSPPLRRGLRRYHSTRYEVTPSSVHTRAYTYVHAYVHETGERGGVWRKGNRRGERERESLPSSVRNLAQAGRSARFNRGFPL